METAREKHSADSDKACGASIPRVTLRGLPAVALTVTLAHWAILGLRVPVFTLLPGWVWPFSYKPAPALWIAPVLALVVIAVMGYVLRSKGKAGLKLIYLMMLGFVIQLGAGLIEGQGINAVRDRIVYSGHAEFARLAVREKNIREFLSSYETRAVSDELGNYARTKAPGQTFLYMATERVANWIRPAATDEERLEWFRTFASVSWPMISCLVLIPMWAFGSRYLGSRQAWLACCLYVLVPSVSLMTLHTDQVFFPLFAMTTVLLCAVAAQKNSMIIGGATGLWFYLTVYCTFGLLAILPLCLTVSLTVMPGTEKRAVRYMRIARIGAAFVAGFVVLDLVFRFVFDYDILLRYRNAMSFHLASKKWQWDLPHFLYFPFLSTLEYVLWLGLAIVVVAFGALKSSLRELRYRNVTMGSVLPAGLLLTLTILAVFGRTGPEAARIWMFLTPFFCVVAAGALVNLAPARARVLVPFFLGLQGVTVIMIKLFQDFQ